MGRIIDNINMGETDWNVATCEVIGKSHIKEGIPCQDKTIACYNSTTNFIGLADGAGSARLSHFGAENVLTDMCQYITENFNSLVNNSDGKAVKLDVFQKISESLDKTAKSLNCSVNDLSSTFLCVAIQNNTFFIVHIGDGVIGYLKNGILAIASKPENGEFANTTVFTTSANSTLTMRLLRGSIENVSGFILMSDGTSESFYDKKHSTLAPVIIKIMHMNAIISHESMMLQLKKSFEHVISNNTQDDCSVAILSRIHGELCDYSYMTQQQKLSFFDLRGTGKINKRILRYDFIIEYLSCERTLGQVARHIRVKRKFAKRYLDELCKIGVVSRHNSMYCRVRMTFSNISKL